MELLLLESYNMLTLRIILIINSFKLIIQVLNVNLFIQIYFNNYKH